MSETGASESLMLDDSDIGDLCISQTDHFTSNDFEEIDYQEGLDCTSEEVMTTEETIVIESADSPSMEQVEIDGTENIEMGEIEDVEMDEVCEEEEELIEELEEENEEEHHLHEQQLIQEEEEQLEEEEFEHKEEVEEEEEGQEEEVLEEMEELEEEFQSLPAPQPPQPQVVYTTVSQPTQNVIFQTKPTLQKVPASTSLTMKQNVAAAAAAQGHQYMIVASPGGGPTNQLVKIVNAPVSSPSGHLQSVITAKSADGSIVQLRSAQTGKPLVATTQGANIQVSNIQSGKPITPTIKKSIQTGQQQQNRNVYAAKMLVGTSGTQSHQNQELLITTSGHDNQQQTFKLITSSSSGGGGNVGNSGKPLTLGQSQMNFVVQSPQSKIQNMLPQKQQQQQQGVYVNKMLQSTTPQASRLGGMTTGKQTPTKILPAPAQNQIRQGNVTNSQLTFTSTQKSIAQPNHQKVIIRGSGMKTGVLGSGQVIRLPANQSIVNSNQVHQIQMPGSRQVQYVRFVSTPSSSPTTSNVMTVGKPKTIQTIGVQQKINSGQQQQQQLVKVVPINATNQQLRTVAPRSTLVAPSTTQRILIPASPMNVGGQNKNTVGIPASRLSQLSTGQAILQANSNVGNFVVLPAQFTMQQPQQHHHHQTPQHKPPVKHKTPFIPPPKDFLDPIKPSVTTTPMVYNSPAPKNSASSLAGNLSTISESSHLASPLPPPQTPPTPRQPKSAASSPADSNGLRPRKPCNCTKSQCLKLYCDCFANGEFCHNCNCNNCSNNLVNENERQRAIKSCLDRNPNAFRPKIGKARDTNDDTRRHNKGCNCKRSGCLKNYCECYEAKIPCSNNCKCRGCRNVDDPVTEKKSAKDLVDAAESRSAQIMMEKARQLAGSAFRPQATTNTGARQPFHFMTDKVVEITCQCLLAQAEEAERNMYDEETSQRLVIEEFGRCLKEIIESAHKAEASSSST